MEQLVGECFLVAGFDGLDQVNEELVLSCGSEGGVDVAVVLEGSVGGYQVLCGVSNV